MLAFDTQVNVHYDYSEIPDKQAMLWVLDGVYLDSKWLTFLTSSNMTLIKDYEKWMQKWANSCATTIMVDRLFLHSANF